jgi:phosphate transport system protein
MDKKHIVKSYDQELNKLKLKIIEMGSACEKQLSETVKSLKSRDQGLAKKIIAEDASVNAIQHEVEHLTINLLAMRQPMAIDLRNVIASLKMASDMERIADYAANIAEYLNDLNNLPLNEPINIIFDMTDYASAMLRDAMEAYEELSIEKAVQAWLLDYQINRSYEKLLQCLRKIMTEQTDKIQGTTALLFIGRCCERIGDHIKNLAEHIHYIVTGSSSIIRSISEKNNV